MKSYGFREAVELKVGRAGVVALAEGRLIPAIESCRRWGTTDLSIATLLDEGLEELLDSSFGRRAIRLHEEEGAPPDVAKEKAKGGMIASLKAGMAAVQKIFAKTKEFLTPGGITKVAKDAGITGENPSQEVTSWLSKVSNSLRQAMDKLKGGKQTEADESALAKGGKLFLGIMGRLIASIATGIAKILPNTFSWWNGWRKENPQAAWVFAAGLAGTVTLLIIPNAIGSIAPAIGWAIMWGAYQLTIKARGMGEQMFASARAAKDQQRAGEAATRMSGGSSRAALAMAR